MENKQIYDFAVKKDAEHLQLSGSLFLEILQIINFRIFILNLLMIVKS